MKFEIGDLYIYEGWDGSSVVWRRDSPNHWNAIMGPHVDSEGFDYHMEEAVKFGLGILVRAGKVVDPAALV